ncbi:MAG: 2-C-methyl-D-erythritol 2,4-cyclodiphosphate synthase [Candidatus Margulisiibacteriota bacterium]|nr:2-C-methyl-D-erythritol 2,4-cyclodiphosphate synthase [Candidatus Margulisiibacteriota bacterium]
MRIGHGYDVHKMRKGRELVIGGVNIPYEKGLLGHSDADVLLHALIDAIIGAMGIGCIGDYFPDYDPQYKGISSLELLARTNELLKRYNYSVTNIDMTIICQEPRLSPYVADMKRNIANVMHVSPDKINIKPKTEEGLGYIGKKQAIAAHAVCLLHKKV